MKRSRQSIATAYPPQLAGRFWLMGFILASYVFGAEPTPLPSVEQGTAPLRNEVAEGWILINELGCYQCHQGKPEIISELPAFDAPSLNRARFRLNKEFVGEWLQYPHSQQSGTRMPSLLHGIPASQRSQITQE